MRVAFRVAPNRTVVSSHCRTKSATGPRFVYLRAAGAPRAKCSSALRGTLGAFGPMRGGVGRWGGCWSIDRVSRRGDYGAVSGNDRAFCLRGHGRGAGPVGSREIRFRSGPRGLDHADARMFVAPDESPRRAALLLQAGGDCPRLGRERATRYLRTAKMRIAARVRQHHGDTS
jgi:hypothetical protein